MNYTENCHLPQWEEQDRVLRTDFNDAFSKLEEIGADHGRLRTMVGDLARDAYRREVQARVFHGRGGENTGMWVNALETREEAGGDGHGWNGKYGISLGGGMPTVKGIKATVIQEAHISTVSQYEYKSRRAAVRFTSDGYGTLETLGIYTWRFTNNVPDEFTYTIRMLRAGTGDVIATAGPFTTESNRPKAVTVNFPLEAGETYVIEYTVAESSKFLGTSEFMLGSSGDVDDDPDLVTVWTMTLGPRQASGELIRTVAPPEWAKRGILLLRQGGDGTVSVSVNSTGLTAAQSRETVNAKGVPCIESEYHLDTLPEGALTIRLDMIKGENELNLFDYGVLWQ